MKFKQRFETERLILREPKKSDWKDVLEACKDIKVTENLSIVPHPYKKSDAEFFVNRCIKWLNKKDKIHYFMELKQNHKLIGVISVMKIELLNGTAGTGSWVNRKYWKKGYMTEAKITLFEYLFNELGIRKLTSEAISSNVGSNKTNRRLGYRYVGMYKEHSRCKATGKIHDLILYELMKKDWKKVLPSLRKRIKKKIKELS
jgi:RimJ/RimL family protein N-acetyltransferase